MTALVEERSSATMARTWPQCAVAAALRNSHREQRARVTQTHRWLARPGWSYSRSVRLDRLPRTYYAFLAVSICGPILLIVNGGGAINRSGLAFFAFLLFGLGRRWRPAWALLVVSNAVPLLAVLGLAAGSGLLLNAALLIVYGVSSLALLFSPSMLDHVRLRRQLTSTTWCGRAALHGLGHETDATPFTKCGRVRRDARAAPLRDQRAS
jgi:hypothetical protein